MLQPFKLDLEFANDIHAIAENTSAIAKSLAVIAGVCAKRDGIAFVDPTKHAADTRTPSNHDPLTPTDNQELERTIGEAYDRLNTPSSDPWEGDNTEEPPYFKLPR